MNMKLYYLCVMYKKDRINLTHATTNSLDEQPGWRMWCNKKMNRVIKASLGAGGTDAEQKHDNARLSDIDVWNIKSGWRLCMPVSIMMSGIPDCVRIITCQGWWVIGEETWWMGSAITMIYLIGCCVVVSGMTAHTHTVGRMIYLFHQLSSCSFYRLGWLEEWMDARSVINITDRVILLDTISCSD